VQESDQISVETIEMALENPFSHGGGCPAWFSAISAHGCRACRFALRCYTGFGWTNSAVRRRRRRRLITARLSVDLGPYETATKRKSSERVSATFMLTLRNGLVLQESACSSNSRASTTSMGSDRNFLFWFWFFVYGNRAILPLERKCARGAGGTLVGRLSEVGKNGRRRKRRNVDALNVGTRRGGWDIRRTP
jgi:hypothetical protein